MRLAQSKRMLRSAMYKVMWSAGSGTVTGPRFAHYSDALRLFEAKKTMASVVILDSTGKIAKAYHRQWNPRLLQSDVQSPRTGKSSQSTAKNPM